MMFEEQFQRIIELNVRFLIYEKSGSGIADRVIHFISSYFVALLTNRLFIFDTNWPEFIDTMQSSLNYEPEFVIPWLSQFNLTKKKLSLDIQNNLTVGVYWFSFDRYTKDYDYEKHCRERILIFKGHTGGVVHTIKSNSSIYRKFLTIDLEMNPENMFGCLYHSLFTYRLFALMKRVPLIPSNNQLADDVRIRQAALKRWKFPLECFQSFENKCQLNNSGLNILSNSNPVFHVQYANDRILAFELGIFDNFLFSLCEQHIISRDSGFGRFAAFASVKLRNIYSMVPNEQSSCQNQSLPLAKAAYYWSGI
ncbi:unnamed protein product [Rotaria sp. Silwood1]|nr:unnamed protein product [Rotaria sp. Silwood1]